MSKFSASRNQIICGNRRVKINASLKYPIHLQKVFSSFIAKIFYTYGVCPFHMDIRFWGAFALASLGRLCHAWFWRGDLVRLERLSLAANYFDRPKLGTPLQKMTKSSAPGVETKAWKISLLSHFKEFINWHHIVCMLQEKNPPILKLRSFILD